MAAKEVAKNILLLEANCRRLVDDSKPGAAMALLEPALAANPKEATLLYTRALVREAKKDPYGAVADLTKAIELDPQYAEAYLLRAKGYSFLSELDFARDYEKRGVQDLDTALRLKPNFAEAYDYRGILLASKGCNGDAVVAFTKAIDCDPRQGAFFEHRAMAFNALKNRPKALLDLSEAVKLDSSKYDRWINLGEQLDTMGLSSRAREAFDRAIALKPKKLNLVNRRAQFFLKHGCYQEAVVDASKILSYSPDDDDALVLRGDAYVGLKQYDRALIDFNRAIQLSPLLAAHYRGRAKLYRLMHRDSLAKEDEAQALRLEQKN